MNQQGNISGLPVLLGLAGKSTMLLQMQDGTSSLISLGCLPSDEQQPSGRPASALLTWPGRALCLTVHQQCASCGLHWSATAHSSL